jgi:hypothetical protein
MKKSYVKHLEMIEKIIERLASNSFKYKGWSITAVSALLALAAKEKFAGYALIGLVPALCFWGLDAYYLRLERAFRELYKSVADEGAAPKAPGATFSMNIGPHLRKVDSWFKIAWSGSVGGLHFPLVLSVVLGAIVIGYCHPPQTDPGKSDGNRAAAAQAQVKPNGPAPQAGP